jgi:Ala-tRNA(Pro) deacylase
MPIPRHICEFLDAHRISYQPCQHPPSYTAQGVAHAQHISGKELAKVVMVLADDRLLMVVLPGSHRLELEQLGQAVGATSVRLATEEEFGHIFPDCEVGAMPPFGNLYNLEVWVDSSLRTHSTIVFNAGTHAETIQMSFTDFARLVQPKEAIFSCLRH